MVDQVVSTSFKPRYMELADHINMAPYQVEMPYTYTPVSQYYYEFGAEPIYDYNEEIMPYMTDGVATIAQMIDLRSMQLPVVIRRDEDVIEIEEILSTYLGRYVRIAKENRMGQFTPEQMQFFSNAESFLDEVRILAKRVIKRNHWEMPGSKMLGHLLKLVRGEGSDE